MAGAQAKTALPYRDGRSGEPSGAAATTHILKPAVVGFDDHDPNEHLCLDAARRVGLVVARTRIMRFGDETAVVVDPYERRVTDAGVVRVHQEDLCQSLSVHPARKDAGMRSGLLDGTGLAGALRLAIACGSLSVRAVGGTGAQPDRSEADAAAASLALIG